MMNMFWNKENVYLFRKSKIMLSRKTVVIGLGSENKKEEIEHVASACITFISNFGRTTFSLPPLS